MVLKRLFSAVAQLLVVALVFSLVLSLALGAGIVDLGIEEGEVETPEPLPDWPFAWEWVLEEPTAEPREGPDIDDEAGGPVDTDPGSTETGAGVTSETIETAVHERINEIRTDGALDPLEFDDDIAERARTYSHDMGEREYFSHTSPEGETPADRFGDRYPGECRAVGENLAMVSAGGGADAGTIADRIVDGWMDSEGHRENILTAEWESQGIGVFIVDGQVYATQKFCSSG